ncbi:MAG: fasciclin domain-containing protein [Phycisphaeraceae bacterium]|nr:fasciclin domain-containing protein [Phycisphaeraceae bacterium]
MKKAVLAVGGIAMSMIAGGLSGAFAQCPSSSGKSDEPRVLTASLENEVAAKSIVETAMADENFSTLVAAIKQAGLVEALSGEGPFTVFAPTNAAFAKVDKAALEALMKDPKALAGVLTYHVVPGRVMASDVTKLTGAVTLQGQRIGVDAKSGVKVDGANVTRTDIVCSNGVIHVIDAVIMPSNKNIVQTAAGAGTFRTLAAALEAAGLVSTLESEGPFTVFAPTDEAFAKLPPETLSSLLKPENREQLRSVLLYHVVPGRVFSEAALKAGKATTAQGSAITIAAKDGKAMVNNAGLVKTDVNASNGVIHVIDTVILPPAAEKK